MIQFKCSIQKVFIYSLLLLFLLLVSGCQGAEDQSPRIEIQPAPSLEIGTATAETVEQETTKEQTGFPPPEETPEIQTAEPTLTALPTTTLSPIPTVNPLSAPPVQGLDVLNLPPINQDLTYVSAGTLWLWTHQNRQISPLFEPEIDSERFPAGTFAEVVLVDFSADGNRAAVAVRYDLPPEEGSSGDGSGDSDSDAVDAGGESEFDILFVDVVSKESWVMVTGIKNEINELTLSPNQAYLVFSTEIEPESDEDEPVGKLFRLNTQAAISPSDLSQVAECAFKCEAITWRKDSDLYFFADQAGAYFANARATQAETLIENETKNQYLPLAWSPNDRAVLMLDRPGEGGATYTILDIPTQQLVPVPSKIQPDTVQLPETIWLADSRIISSFVLWESGTVFLATYRVNFDEGGIGIDEEISLPELGMLGSLKQLPDGRFVFVRPSLTDPEIAGLYHLTSFSETPERINAMQLSGDTPDGIWSLDGSTAVIQSMNSYIAAADGNLYQFEQRLKQPEWLAPSNAQR